MERRNRLKESLGSFLSLLCDLMVLNVLWLLCSVPVVTIGPSTCALFACMLKISRDELSDSTFKTFFKAFKDNFRNAFFYGLIALAALFIVYVDFSFALSQTGTLRTVFLIVSGAASAALLVFVSYVFPLQARYENTFKGQLRNAFLLSFCSPASTILMWIVYAIPVVLLFFVPFNIVLRVGFLFLMFGFSLPAYYNCKTLRKIFDKFVKDNKNDQPTEGDSSC